jgi:hypothetical protein
MKSKAALAKALSDRGIPLPKEDSYSAMAHRLATWIPGNGFLFRRMKVRRFARQSPMVLDVPIGEVVWVPNSDFARQIFKTKAMWFLGRKPFKESYTLLDVPMTEEYVEPVEEKKAEAPKKAKAPAKKAAAPKKKAKVSKSGGDDGPSA